MLGRESEVVYGRKREVMRTCPGEKRTNNRKQTGRGSQSDISQTSSLSSGCVLLSGLSDENHLGRIRNGDAAAGDESTLTLFADRAFGDVFTSELNNRYCFVRARVKMAFSIEKDIKATLRRKHYKVD